MDRKIKKSSKATLLPAPEGWRAIVDSGTSQDFPSFADAAASIPANAAVRVMLPVRMAIFERLTLPSLDREELSGMVVLQLEKTLPYPVEETTYGFEILSQTETESTLIATVVHNPAVENLCAPLTHRKQYPGQLSIWATHVAEQTPSQETVCGLWQEEGAVVFAVFEKGKLSFSELIPSVDDLLVSLPQVLMSAELAGAPVEFSTVLLDPALSGFREAAEQFLGTHAHELHAHPVTEPSLVLTLDAWRQAVSNMGRAARIRGRLMLAGAAYVVLFALALVYLWVMGQRLRSITNELTVLQPQVDTVLAQQKKWTVISAATDYHRYTVELLFQIYNSLPSPDVRITQFDQGVGQFMVEGEAPNASLAVQFLDKLKAQPGLADYRFEAGPPAFLQNGHAQFKVFAKL